MELKEVKIPLDAKVEFSSLTQQTLCGCGAIAVIEIARLKGKQVELARWAMGSSAPWPCRENENQDKILENAVMAKTATCSCCFCCGSDTTGILSALDALKIPYRVTKRTCMCGGNYSGCGCGIFHCFTWLFSNFIKPCCCCGSRSSNPPLGGAATHRILAYSNRDMSGHYVIKNIRTGEFFNGPRASGVLNQVKEDDCALVIEV